MKGFHHIKIWPSPLNFCLATPLRMENDFSIFHTGQLWPLSSIPFHTKIFFHLPFQSIPRTMVLVPRYYFFKLIFTILLKLFSVVPPAWCKHNTSITIYYLDSGVYLEGWSGIGPWSLSFLVRKELKFTKNAFLMFFQF